MGRAGQRRPIDAITMGVVIGALVGAAGLGMGLGRDPRLPAIESVAPATILAGGHSHIPVIEPAQSDAFVTATRAADPSPAADPFLAATQPVEPAAPFLSGLLPMSPAG